MTNRAPLFFGICCALLYWSVGCPAAPPSEPAPVDGSAKVEKAVTDGEQPQDRAAGKEPEPRERVAPPEPTPPEPAPREPAGKEPEPREQPREQPPGETAPEACPQDLPAAIGKVCRTENKICRQANCAKCSFCNLIRCSGGKWSRLEVPPDPSCREKTPDAGVKEAPPEPRPPEVKPNYGFVASTVKGAPFASIQSAGWAPVGNTVVVVLSDKPGACPSIKQSGYAFAKPYSVLRMELKGSTPTVKQYDTTTDMTVALIYDDNTGKKQEVPRAGGWQVQNVSGGQIAGRFTLGFTGNTYVQGAITVPRCP